TYGEDCSATYFGIVSTEANINEISFSVDPPSPNGILSSFVIGQLDLQLYPAPPHPYTPDDPAAVAMTPMATDPNSALPAASPASSTKAAGMGSQSRFVDALQSPVSPKQTGIQDSDGMKGARHSPDIINSWDSSLLGASAALASTTLDNLFAQSKV